MGPKMLVMMVIGVAILATTIVDRGARPTHPGATTRAGPTRTGGWAMTLQGFLLLAAALFVRRACTARCPSSRS